MNYTNYKTYNDTESIKESENFCNEIANAIVDNPDEMISVIVADIIDKYTDKYESWTIAEEIEEYITIAMNEKTGHDSAWNVISNGFRFYFRNIYEDNKKTIMENVMCMSINVSLSEAQYLGNCFGGKYARVKLEYETLDELLAMAKELLDEMED